MSPVTRTDEHRRRTAQLALVLSFILLLGACAGAESTDDAAADAAAPSPSPAATAAGAPATSTPAPTDTTTAAFPATIDAANGSVTISDPPEQIVSLSPTATEMLFAIGAGEQVVAVDDQSDFPPEAPTTDLSGFQPNVEAIAGYEPDLVVISNDTTEEGSLSDSLEEVGIPVLLQPAATTIDDTYTQIEQLGRATGNVEEAADTVAQIRTDLEEALAAAPDFAEAPAIYHELDPNYFTATSDTFIGSVYEQFGVDNIADAADAASDFPQLSEEYILEADPDVVFLADTDCCDVTPESVAQRPGWEQITAVEEGNVVTVGDDVASRWGPRVVEFAERVGGALQSLDSADAG